MTPGCYFTKVDLQKAYRSVGISKAVKRSMDCAGLLVAKQFI